MILALMARWSWIGVGLTTCGLGCAPTPGPCLAWVRPGETYDVTVGSPDPIPRPYAGFDPKSCGAGFDMQAGDGVELGVENQEPRSPACDLLKISSVSAIHNVSLGDAGDVSQLGIRPELEAGFPHATVGTACRGAYRFGLNSTDRLRAYRTFRAETPEECAGEGVFVSTNDPHCWDSWRVEVKDSKGVVVATSLE